MTKSNLRGKGSPQLTLLHHSPVIGSHERNPEAGTAAEPMEEGCLLTCSPRLIQPDFLHTQDYLHRCGTNNRLSPVNCHNQGNEGNALQTGL